jgi:hypothetical protein
MWRHLTKQRRAPLDTYKLFRFEELDSWSLSETVPHIGTTDFFPQVDNVNYLIDRRAGERQDSGLQKPYLGDIPGCQQSSINHMLNNCNNALELYFFLDSLPFYADVLGHAVLILWRLPMIQSSLVGLPT